VIEVALHNTSAMTSSDLDGLRKHFTEKQFFDIAAISCLFNFMDRIADGFGVELDPIISRLAALSLERRGADRGGGPGMHLGRRRATARLPKR
jgi:hypothetical protein